MDAPDAKWTLDLCNEQSDAWPIHFSRIMPWPGLLTKAPGKPWYRLRALSLSSVAA